DERRHHDEAATDAEQRADEADEEADDQHRQHADIEARLLEADTHGQAMDPVVLVGQPLADNHALALPEDGAGGLDQHHDADRTEQDQEAQRDDKVELAGIAQEREG